MGFSLEDFLHNLELVRRAGLSDREAAQAYDALVEEGYGYAVLCNEISELGE